MQWFTPLLPTVLELLEGIRMVRSLIGIQIKPQGPVGSIPAPSADA